MELNYGHGSLTGACVAMGQVTHQFIKLTMAPYNLFRERPPAQTVEQDPVLGK